MTCRGKHGAPNLSSRSAGNNLVGPTQPAIPIIGGKTIEARALHFLRFFCETDCGRYTALSTCYATLLPKSNFASTPCVRACMRACVCSANK